MTGEDRHTRSFAHHPRRIGRVAPITAHGTVITQFRASRWSLAQRLSLLLFLVVTAIVTTFGVTAYREVDNATRSSAIERLSSLARESGQGGARSMSARLASWSRTASDTTVVAATVRGDPSSIAILKERITRRGVSDSTLVARAIYTNGRILVSDGEPSNVDSVHATALIRQAMRGDSAVLGALYMSDSVPHLIAAAPIRQNRHNIGAMVWWFRIGRNPGSEATISNLLGTPTQVFITDRTGSLWLDAQQHQVDPKVAQPMMDSLVNRPAKLVTDGRGRSMHMVAADIASTPFRIVMLQDEQKMMARPRSLGLKFGATALVLVLFSTLAVWWISRYMQHDLEAQNRALHEANASKARFLGVMSHELRTPLNAIAGHAELIALGVHGPTTPDQDHALVRIQRNKDQLLHLVNDLLFFARLDSKPLPVASEPVLLKEQFDALGENLRHEFDRKRVTLTLHPTTSVVIGDAVRVQQVLVNLVTNAWRFTDAGGAVDVRADTHGARCRIEVRDTGLGIAPEDLPHVFDPFVQADGSLTRRSGGAGLGLTIVRTLVHAMGGEVAAESTPRKGSVFRCWLPASSAVAAPRADVLETAPSPWVATAPSEASVLSGPQTPD